MVTLFDQKDFTEINKQNHNTYKTNKLFVSFII